MVDEILKFERGIAPYLGYMVDRSSQLPQAVLRDGCLGALCQQPTYLVRLLLLR